MTDSNTGGEATILEERRRKLEELRAEIKRTSMILFHLSMRLICMNCMEPFLKMNLKKLKSKI